MKEIVAGGFQEAINDYFWLLNKRYPQRLVFKIVCDRYQLHTLQRVVLYRGIFPACEVASRKEKEMHILDGKHLSVDTFNVLFKLTNYLCGRPVFICNDGLLRDAGDAFDKHFPGDILGRALDMMINYIQRLPLCSVHFLIDQPVEGSGMVKDSILSGQAGFAFPCFIEMAYPADRRMNGDEPHVIATADSEIIDRSKSPYFDMAKAILDEAFNPDYISVSKLLAV